MALRGKKPEAIKKRLKALFYGQAGVGKTTAAISFPAPYLIDTEKGAENTQYVELLKRQQGAIFQTNQFDEMINEIKSLLSEKHPYKTLIIDPITVVYNDLLDVCAKRLSKDGKDGTEFGRHYGEANKHMKHMLNLLLRLDMNVIITAHAKNEYGHNLAVLGQTFDGYKKLDYLFDLVFEIQKRGKERVGIVKKTRIETFGDNDQFPFSYETIAEKYGRDLLEKTVNVESLATPSQVTELNRFIELLKVTPEIVDKWLDKAGAATFEEMETNTIQTVINQLKSKLEAA